MGQVLSEEFLLGYVLICLIFVVANMLEHSNNKGLLTIDNYIQLEGACTVRYGEIRASAENNLDVSKNSWQGAKKYLSVSCNFNDKFDSKTHFYQV